MGQKSGTFGLEATVFVKLIHNAVCVVCHSGHDCSVRVWNVESKQCLQEMTAHRKKFDEAIHDVAFHPSKPFIASAGADGLAKVYV